MTFHVGQFVRAVDALDTEIHDVSAFVGSVGIVRSLSTSVGGPEDPMYEVEFTRRRRESFWCDELAPVDRRPQ